MTWRTLLLWGHPAAGLTAVSLLVRAARLGVTSRTAGPAASRARAAHVALTPWLLGWVVVVWLGGVTTVWFDRADLEVAASGHFRVGTGIVVALGSAAMVSRWIGDGDWARRLHPWLGAVAVLLAGVQVFLGLQIMPR